MIFGVADDGIAGASELLFSRAGDRGIQRGKNKIAIESWLQSFYD
jgi:hypothetical protein